MKKLLTFTAVCLLAVTAVAQDYPIQGVPFTSVTLNDNFWAPRLKVHREVTIPIALYQCYNTGRVDNFLKAGRLKEGEHHVALKEKCPNGNQAYDHTLRLYLPARTAFVLKQV